MNLCLSLSQILEFAEQRYKQKMNVSFPDGQLDAIGCIPMTIPFVLLSASANEEQAVRDSPHFLNVHFRSFKVIVDLVTDSSFSDSFNAVSIGFFPYYPPFTVSFSHSCRQLSSLSDSHTLTPRWKNTWLYMPVPFMPP